MIGCFKFLAVLFVILALLSLGHDIWRAYSIKNDFTLSQIGGLFEHYTPEEFANAQNAVADTTGVKTFNMIFAPILSLPTVVFTGGLAAIFTGLMFLAIRLKHGPRAKKATNFRHRPNY